MPFSQEQPLQGSQSLLAFRAALRISPASSGGRGSSSPCFDPDKVALHPWEMGIPGRVPAVWVKSKFACSALVQSLIKQCGFWFLWAGEVLGVRSDGGLVEEAWWDRALGVSGGFLGAEVRGLLLSRFAKRISGSLWNVAVGKGGCVASALPWRSLGRARSVVAPRGGDGWAGGGWSGRRQRRRTCTWKPDPSREARPQFPYLGGGKAHPPRTQELAGCEACPGRGGAPLGAEGRAGLLMQAGGWRSSDPARFNSQDCCLLRWGR